MNDKYKFSKVPIKGVTIMPDSYTNIYECQLKEDPSIKLCVKEVELNQRDQQIFKAIYREQQMTCLISKIASPYILKIYDVFTSDNKLQIIMEQGTSLQSIINKNCSDYEFKHLLDNQPIEFYLDLIYQITQNYLIFETNSIIHRDIKPSNIIVQKSGSQYFYKLIDFGFSRIYDNQATITRGGTREYASPQMLLYPGSACKVTNKTDVFSLGILLYKLIYDEFPYTDIASQFEFFYNIKIQKFKFPEKFHNFANVVLLQELILKMIKIDEGERFSWTDLHHYLLKMKFKRRDSIFLDVKTNEFKLFREQDKKFCDLTKQERFIKMLKLIEKRVQFLEKQLNFIEKNQNYLIKAISSYNFKLLKLLLVILQKEQYQNGRALITQNLLLLSKQIQQQYDTIYLYNCLKEFNLDNNCKEEFLQKCRKQNSIYRSTIKDTIGWIEKLALQTRENMGLNEFCAELQKGFGEQNLEFLIVSLQDLCSPIWKKLTDEEYQVMQIGIMNRHKFMIDSYRDRL